MNSIEELTGLEALEQLEYLINVSINELSDWEEAKQCVKIIEHDLERLEKLEIERFEDMLITEQNIKLKKVIEILKGKIIQDRFLEETKNVDEYNKWVSNLMRYAELTQEEYDLLKEIFGNV